MHDYSKVRTEKCAVWVFVDQLLDNTVLWWRINGYFIGADGSLILTDLTFCCGFLDLAYKAVLILCPFQTVINFHAN